MQFMDPKVNRSQTPRLDMFPNRNNIKLTFIVIGYWRRSSGAMEINLEPCRHNLRTTFRCRIDRASSYSNKRKLKLRPSRLLLLLLLPKQASPRIPNRVR